MSEPRSEGDERLPDEWEGDGVTSDDDPSDDAGYAPAETAILGDMLDQALGRRDDPDEGSEPDDPED